MRDSLSLRLAKYTHKQKKIPGGKYGQFRHFGQRTGTSKRVITTDDWDKIPLTVIKIPTEVHSLGRSPQNVNEKLISQFKKEMEDFI